MFRLKMGYQTSIVISTGHTIRAWYTIYPSQTETIMNGLGHCPLWLLGCPRCLCDVTCVNPPTQNVMNAGSWCQSITCKSCGYCWYVCTVCKNMRKHMDSNAKLVRHAKAFHEVVDSRQFSKKRKKESPPDNFVITDVDIESDSTGGTDPPDYDTVLESYSNEGPDDVLLETVHPPDSWEQSHHTTKYDKVLPDFSRSQSSRFF